MKNDGAVHNHTLKYGIFWHTDDVFGREIRQGCRYVLLYNGAICGRVVSSQSRQARAERLGRQTELV
jgi:hypothetical protein